MELTRLEKACPGCGTIGVFPFCELQAAPVNVGRTELTREIACQVDRGNIVLGYCDTCGLVHNIEFDASKVGFKPGYEVALHHSDTFRNFITNLAKRLIEKYNLQNRRILDIGCGGGYFLETLCKAGPNQGVGVDPTVAKEGRFDVGAGTVKFIRDFWSSDHVSLIGDFITCQSVFEAIPNPLKFLQELRSMIGARNIPVYFEVFNGYRAFEKQETWSIHYEQCNYFNLDCLQKIFSLSGFRVVEAGHCYESDQYLYVEAFPARRASTKLSSTSIPETIREFARLHANRAADWTRQLDNWKVAGKTVAIWGSGGKGVNFLNSVRSSETIAYVVDINPDRQGTYVPGSGHRIVPPDHLLEEKPDAVILTNSLYQREITKQIQEFGIECDVRVA